MRRGRSFSTFLGVFVLVVVLASCGGTGKPESERTEPKSHTIRKETRRGPFCVRLLTDKDSLTIADFLTLTIEAEVEEGFEAKLPRFGEKLGEFGIRDYRDEPPRLTPEKKLVSRKVYTLEPFLSGDYVISPMAVRFRKQAETGTGDQNSTDRGGTWEHEIATEEITVKVTSLLDHDQQDRALNPIKGPVALPASPLPTGYVLAALGAILVLGGVAFILWKRRKAANGMPVAPPLIAHERAYRELQELLDAQLIEQGQSKLFFSKLSDVLRGYIENRFGLQAPRRTTEEFLAAISSTAPFPPEHRKLLAEFLQSCDLVKFAEHAPEPDEVAKAVDSCRAFIDATRQAKDGGQERGGRRKLERRRQDSDARRSLDTETCR